MEIRTHGMCNAITKRGEPCSNRAKHAGLYCGIHKHLGLTTEERCSIGGVGLPTQCKYGKAPGMEICQHHLREQRREETRALFVFHYTHIEASLLIEYGELMTSTSRIIIASQGAQMKIDRPELSYDEIRAQLVHQLIPALAQRRPPPGSLAEIALDRQSIHRSAVSKQTNEGIDYLMKTPVPHGQNTLQEIRTEWTRIFVRKPVQDILYEDMELWYSKSLCRETDDYLYKRLLDHAWATIKRVEDKSKKRELIKRLQQECAEAYGMCCDGHINRIVNTFVGFFEEVAPPVSVGEILQQKMAEISLLDDVEERMTRATAVFAELGVDVEQAAPWIEALA
jgi:hypothetical protein